MEADWSVELAADDAAILVPWNAVPWNVVPWNVVPWNVVPWSGSSSSSGSTSGNGPVPRTLSGMVAGSVPEEPDPMRLQFLDLRHDPAAIEQIAEAHADPALRSALLTLNGPRSRLWTVKCGLWESGSQAADAVPVDVHANVAAEIDPWEMDAEPEDTIFAAGCYIDIVPLDSEAAASFAIMENWLRNLTEQLRRVAMRCARADFVLRRSEIHGVQGFAVTWFIEACGATSELAALRRSEALARALPIVMDVAPATPRVPVE